MKQHYLKFLIFILIISFYGGRLSATHIVGGEMNYKYLGGNNYEIRLTVYRDCYNGVPPFDNPAYLGVFNVFNILVYSYALPLTQVDTVQPYIYSPCLTPPLDVCYERTTYTTIINLPPTPGGYQLVYQRCCRNFTITNIALPDDQGITIYATIPDKIPVPINSNPVFKNWPPPFICLNYPFIFDHSATDIDGDLIRYELCTPLNGAQSTPQPIPPENPPYANIPWATGYSVFNMLGGSNPLKIDSVTGIMTAIPNTIGQFVVGVCAKEYRNGYLISETKRDFQINVVPCPGLTTAYFPNPIKQCGNKTVHFQNSSAGAVAYHWDFGDLTTNTDTSNAFSPSYTYPTAGTYTVKLIAISDSVKCNDTITGNVIIYPDHDADFTVQLDTCNATIHLNDTSNITGGTVTAVNWNFGDGTLSNSHDPVYSYATAGTYAVTLISVSQYGCKDTIVNVVTVPDPFFASINGSNNVTCYDSCNGNASITFTGGTLPINILWNDPIHQTTTTASNLCAGTFTVIVTDVKGCSISNNITIAQPAVITHTITATDAYCGGLCIGTATNLISGGTLPYSYIWNDPNAQTNATATSLCPGAYMVNVTDANGCKSKDTITVYYSDYVPPVTASIDHDTAYASQTIQLLATQANYTYQWSPGAGLNNTQIFNPTAVLDSGFYTYIVIITDDKGCTNTDTVSVYVKQVNCVEPELYVPNAFSPNDDGVNDIFYVHGNTIKEMRFEVYDRWGQKVFESNKPSFGWDGTFKGKKLTPAVYDYFVEITCLNNEKFFKKGNITLLK